MKFNEWKNIVINELTNRGYLINKKALYDYMNDCTDLLEIKGFKKTSIYSIDKENFCKNSWLQLYNIILP